MISVSANGEVPLVMKMSRGSDDLRSNGTNVLVTMCVPVVLTFHDLFHMSLKVIFRDPALKSGSNWAPSELSFSTCLYMINEVQLTCVVDQDIHMAISRSNLVEGSGDRIVIFDVYLDCRNSAKAMRKFRLSGFGCSIGFVNASTSEQYGVCFLGLA